MSVLRSRLVLFLLAWVLVLWPATPADAQLRSRITPTVSTLSASPGRVGLNASSMLASVEVATGGRSFTDARVVDDRGRVVRGISASTSRTRAGLRVALRFREARIGTYRLQLLEGRTWRNVTLDVDVTADPMGDATLSVDMEAEQVWVPGRSVRMDLTVSNPTSVEAVLIEWGNGRSHRVDMRRRTRATVELDIRSDGPERMILFDFTLIFTDGREVPAIVARRVDLFSNSRPRIERVDPVRALETHPLEYMVTMVDDHGFSALRVEFQGRTFTVPIDSDRPLRSDREESIRIPITLPAVRLGRNDADPPLTIVPIDDTGLEGRAWRATARMQRFLPTSARIAPNLLRPLGTGRLLVTFPFSPGEEIRIPITASPELQVGSELVVPAGNGVGMTVELAFGTTDVEAPTSVGIFIPKRYDTIIADATIVPPSAPRR